MRTTGYIVALFVCLVFLECASCYNILVIFSHLVKSRYYVFRPLFQELAERGHNLTIISHISTKKDIKNVRDVLLSTRETRHLLDVKFIGGRRQRYFEPKMLSDSARMICESSLKAEPFQSFLREEHNYHLALVDLFNTNCFFGLVNKLKIPYIALSPCAMMPWQSGWFGTPSNPSYIPSVFLAPPVPMTFLQRLENTLIHLAHIAWYKIYMENPGTELSRKYVGYDPVDPYNASLFLVNIHHTFQGSRPLSPSVVEIGGLHVFDRKPEKLPEDVEQWIDGATNGLIYFSMGSVLKGHTFPRDKLEIFNKVFAELPYRVLWKWESDDLPGKPDNVKTIKWAQQFDILCQPNTKLFISHGGLLGTTESVYCGVPVLAMPQFGDQPLNAQALKQQGAAVILDLKDVTYDRLKEAITESFKSKIQQNAKELSARFRDRLVSPLDTSVYWVEHVARYRGAAHLKSAAVDMPFYQYALLDVVAFLLGCYVICTYILYKCARRFFRKTKPNKKKVKKH